MPIIDLTHTITPGMPVYPGTAPPAITTACTIAEHGFKEQQVTMFTHTGTHIDSPAHVLENGMTLDMMDPGHFYGLASLIDVSAGGEKVISLATVKSQLRPGLDFVIFYTGWYLQWGRPQYFADYPVPARDALAYLIRQGIKGVGLDTISIDAVGNQGLENHRLVLQNNVIIIENLTNLAQLAGSIFTLVCLPLKIQGAEGAPARAIAILD